MNQYVTGSIIRRIREDKRLTQAELASKLLVSDKTVSKWETGRGFPDISMLEPIAQALGISVIELLAGSDVINTNRSFNMKKTKFYVCPICGNVIACAGEAVISCCGITLPPLEAEPAEEGHKPEIVSVEDEYYLSFPHSMTKDHYISFIAAIQDNGIQITKLYPEGPAEARFQRSRVVRFVYCCNRHGLFSLSVPARRR